MGGSHRFTAPLELRGFTLDQMPVSSSSIAAGDHTTNTIQSPVHRVLETPELLENILAYLPYTHKASPLELCRRVNRFFRNTIDQSLMLQRNLFLKSNGRSSPMDTGYDSGFIIYKGKMHCCYYELHPLLLRTDPNPDSDFATYFYIYNIVESGYVHDQPVQFDLHRFTQTFENVSGLCGDSSIHKMFITNLPTKVVEIGTCVDLVNPCVEEIFTDSFEDFEKEQERLKHAKYQQGRCARGNIPTSDDGITFGQLFEYTKEMVAGLKKEDVHPYQTPPFISRSWSEDWESESEWSNTYASDCEKDWETVSEGLSTHASDYEEEVEA
jgi:hypothetical protein